MNSVALVLSSGGPRGFAYIGTIEEILRRGYVISSVTGTSAGALVGGVYAAGGMETFKEWITGLSLAQVMTLMDPSFTRTALVKGERLMQEIRKRVPDVHIENLSIPFTAVATDLYTGEEVLFREGPLFDAVRASISIPSMFEPVRIGIHTLVDGGICNTFPLNRAVRKKDDILVGFNVNEIDAAGIRSYLDSRRELDSKGAALKEEAEHAFKETFNAPGTDSLRRMRELIVTGIETVREDRRLESDGRDRRIPTRADGNVASILDRSFGIMNCDMARQNIALFPPDILVSLPYDSYQGVAAYSRAKEIIEKGRELMSLAFDRFEACRGLSSNL